MRAICGEGCHFTASLGGVGAAMRVLEAPCKTGGGDPAQIEYYFCGWAWAAARKSEKIRENQTNGISESYALRSALSVTSCGLASTARPPGAPLARRSMISRSRSISLSVSCSIPTKTFFPALTRMSSSSLT
jgi:hypothetical protein